jgi:hypothetical protein
LIKLQANTATPRKISCLSWLLEITITFSRFSFFIFAYFSLRNHSSVTIQWIIYERTSFKPINWSYDAHVYFVQRLVFFFFDIQFLANILQLIKSYSVRKKQRCIKMQVWVTIGNQKEITQGDLAWSVFFSSFLLF